MATLTLGYIAASPAIDGEQMERARAGLPVGIYTHSAEPEEDEWHISKLPVGILRMIFPSTISNLKTATVTWTTWEHFHFLKNYLVIT